jgi:uncharacterized protein (DUF1015 family)
MRPSTVSPACGNFEDAFRTQAHTSTMAQILPFRALHYNPTVAGDLARVVTQPYDKISPAMQTRYLESSPYNLAHIIRGPDKPGDKPDSNVYTRAANYLEEWIRAGALTADREPALFPYTQEYAPPGEPSERKERRAFIALLRLEDYSARVVHRHEETLSGPKADRLELLKHTRAHFGQLFMLYSDPAGEVESAFAARSDAPAWECVDDEYGTRHSVWRETQDETIKFVTEAMRDKKLVIADGHHRYETALAYRDFCRAGGKEDPRAEFVMATFVRIETPGLTILPTHRVVHSLANFDWKNLLAKAGRLFECEEIAAGEPLTATLGRLRTSGQSQPTLLAYAGAGRSALLRLRREAALASELPDVPAGIAKLDIVLLHRLLLEKTLGISREAVRDEKHVRYAREATDAAEQVARGEAQAAFLLNPTPIRDVWDNALAGNVLPQKSTDFYPKLLSGLAAYWLDHPAGI